jgi:hypothetical protein
MQTSPQLRPESSDHRLSETDRVSTDAWQDMNARILEGARRGERLTAGALERLFGSPAQESRR